MDKTEDAERSRAAQIERMIRKADTRRIMAESTNRRFARKYGLTCDSPGCDQIGNCIEGDTQTCTAHQPRLS